SDMKRAAYRVRGDSIELWPAYERFAVRIDLFGDEVERIEFIDPTSGEILATEKQVFIYPAVHYVMPDEKRQAAVAGIREELDARVLALRAEGRLLEAQRLLARTKYDLELIEEVGFCSGIENYSRWFDGRAPGEKPYTLFDYFEYAPPRDDPRASPTKALRRNGDDWLLIIDESHVTIPQIRAMYNGDQARKRVLVEHGFRLPSALDNRPMTFEEFEQSSPQVLYVSATPGEYELKASEGEVVEQVIRPTGLLDPQIVIHPARGQVADLLERCAERVERGERVLVTALTKRLCEDLSRYIEEQGFQVGYLHSEVDTLDRMRILTELREGDISVLAGVNLLREGLDLPEVSLIAILDADKEGFLRSPTSLIQQMGRAARNVNGTVVMYADSMTPAMQAAIDETERRRAKQEAYNEAHGITPRTIEKSIRRGLESELQARRTARQAVGSTEEEFEAAELASVLEEEMLEAAQSLDFEKAATLRDQVRRLRSNPEAKVRRSDLEEKKTTRRRKKRR
ncbi:MAG: UvrB/UvrC motif-containing protein, partial [Phycisphaerales bacterium]|nr:UvrB/UvrC motif-containing protein [Phycisphaerales bacterium]